MLKEMYLNFFTRKSACQHEKITPTSFGKFCPECGKEIEISWHILRCEGCNSKREAYLSINKIVPFDKHCTKCGYMGYYIEKKDKLEFYELDYAVLIKEIVKEDVSYHKRVQIWIDQENVWANYTKPKLIPSLSK